MIPITASGSEVLTDPELLKLCRSAITLIGRALPHLSFTAILKWLVQYSTTLDLSSYIFLEKTRTASVAKDLLSRGLVRCAVESDCRR